MKAPNIVFELFPGCTCELNRENVPSGVSGELFSRSRKKSLATYVTPAARRRFRQASPHLFETSLKQIGSSSSLPQDSPLTDGTRRHRSTPSASQKKGKALWHRSLRGWMTMKRVKDGLCSTIGALRNRTSMHQLRRSLTLNIGA